jgi:non-ribosomal peptide synthetase component F
LLSSAERHQLLTEWSDTQAPLPEAGLLPDLFTAQAARTPERPAVVDCKEQITYRELASRVEKLAAHLQTLGVGPDVLVAPYLDRSVDLVVGLLGVLKAGGAYLPLEVSHPRERLAGMLADARVPLVLTHTRLLADLPAHSARTVCLDDLRESPAFAHPALRPDPDHLAYVLYTSGSTGKPKGVAVTHRGLANYLAWAGKAYPAGVGRGAPVHSPVSFDLTVTSLFLPLLAGSGVVLVSEEEGLPGWPRLSPRAVSPWSSSPPRIWSCCIACCRPSGRRAARAPSSSAASRSPASTSPSGAGTLRICA